MAGFFTYISVFLLVGIWIIGWAAIAAITGAFFKLSLGPTSLAGATLGPLGFIVVLLLGVAERRSSRVDYPQTLLPTQQFDLGTDPFS